MTQYSITVLRLLVNIYADDTKVYGYTFKNQDNQSLAADLSSEQDLTAQQVRKSGL